MHNLTGRTKEKFDNFCKTTLTKQVGFSACYHEGSIEQDIYEIFDHLPLIMQCAYIKLFFDCSGIYIEDGGTDMCGLQFYYCVRSSKVVGDINKQFVTTGKGFQFRTEALCDAFRVANEILNKDLWR